MLTTEFVQFCLVESSILPHLVNTPLSLFSEEKGNGQLQRIKFLLRVDISGCIHKL